MKLGNLPPGVNALLSIKGKKKTSPFDRMSSVRCEECDQSAVCAAINRMLAISRRLMTLMGVVALAAAGVA